MGNAALESRRCSLRQTQKALRLGPKILNALLGFSGLFRSLFLEPPHPRFGFVSLSFGFPLAVCCDNQVCLEEVVYPRDVFYLSATFIWEFVQLRR